MKINCKKIQRNCTGIAKELEIYYKGTPFVVIAKPPHNPKPPHKVNHHNRMQRASVEEQFYAAATKMSRLCGFCGFVEEQTYVTATIVSHIVFKQNCGNGRKHTKHDFWIAKLYFKM